MTNNFLKIRGIYKMEIAKLWLNYEIKYYRQYFIQLFSYAVPRTLISLVVLRKKFKPNSLRAFTNF